MKTIDVDFVREVRGYTIYSGLNHLNLRYYCVAKGKNGMVEGKKLRISLLNKYMWFWDKNGIILGKYMIEWNL